MTAAIAGAEKLPPRTMTADAAGIRWTLDGGGLIEQAAGSREIKCSRCHATHPAITTITDLGAFMRAHDGAACSGAAAVKNTRAKRAP